MNASKEVSMNAREMMRPGSQFPVRCWNHSPTPIFANRQSVDTSAVNSAQWEGHSAQWEGIKQNQREGNFSISVR